MPKQSKNNLPQVGRFLIKVTTEAMSKRPMYPNWNSTVNTSLAMALMIDSGKETVSPFPKLIMSVINNSINNCAPKVNITIRNIFLVSDLIISRVKRYNLVLITPETLLLLSL